MVTRAGYTPIIFDTVSELITKSDFPIETVILEGRFDHDDLQFIHDRIRSKMAKISIIFVTDHVDNLERVQFHILEKPMTLQSLSKKIYDQR